MALDGSSEEAEDGYCQCGKFSRMPRTGWLPEGQQTEYGQHVLFRSAWFARILTGGQAGFEADNRLYGTEKLSLATSLGSSGQ